VCLCAKMDERYGGGGGGPLKEVEKLTIDETAFEALERDFQEVLSELSGDKSLERFRVEYEKLHRALKKSHDSEKRLRHKCRELNAEIVANAAKVETALKLSQDDQNTISSLRKEIENAWKMVDQSHEREAKAKEAMQQLRKELSELQKLVEQGAGLGMGHESNLAELIEAKESLTRERDSLMDTVVQLRKEISDLVERQQKSESERSEAEMEVSRLRELIASKKSESEREMRKKERLEREMKEARAALEAKSGDIKLRQEEIERMTEHNTRLEQQLREQRQALEKAGKEYEALTSRTLKLQQDYEEQVQGATQLAAENQQKLSEVKVKEEEIARLEGELQKANKTRDVLLRKLQQHEEEKLEIKRQKDELRTQISGLDRELDQLKKQAEGDRKMIDDLVRERDILNKNLLKAAGSTQKQQSLVKIHEQQKKHLEQEVEAYKEELQKQRNLLYQLEKERDRYVNEASEMTQRCLQAMEEVKRREIQIFDFKKKIAEAETKLKQQQNLYEAVRSDRNLYSKNLIECQDEITEMKRKLKIMNHQIDQLKEEIGQKEAALVKEHFEHLRVDKEKEALVTETNRLKHQAKLDKSLIENQETEAGKLRQIIQDADEERQRQKKQLDQVVNERDILGAQLIRRNDELALLYEKIKTQQAILNKGEVQYKERFEDIRVLKLEIKKMRREKRLLMRNVQNVEVLRREVFHLQRELLRERTRCKALEEELENPMNIHRWRKLEGSDPSTYEMIQKIQALQKRLITKTEEVVEKELRIQERERQYLELKNILARQPGPEVAEQLSIYQQTLKDKTRQMKSMASELNMYQAQVNEYKYEIERTTRELTEMKKKYFDQRRREQQARCVWRGGE
jgi:chromosome segregation ATPase